MRTAHTIAKTHAGQWRLVAAPGEDLIQQRATFREVRAAKFHSEYALVQYQENDGAAQTAILLTPEQYESREKQRAKDHEAFKANQNGEAPSPVVKKAPKLKLTPKALAGKSRLELFEISQQLVDAKRLDEIPSGSIEEITKAILAAKPESTEPPAPPKIEITEATVPEKPE